MKYGTGQTQAALMLGWRRETTHVLTGNEPTGHLMKVCEDGGVATSGFSGPVFKMCLTCNCCQNPIIVKFSSSFHPSSVF